MNQKTQEQLQTIKLYLELWLLEISDFSIHWLTSVTAENLPNVDIKLTLVHIQENENENQEENHAFHILEQNVTVTINMTNQEIKQKIKDLWRNANINLLLTYDD